MAPSCLILLYFSSKAEILVASEVEMARVSGCHGASRIPARRIQNLTAFLWKCMWHERHVLKLKNVCLLNPPRSVDIS